MQAPKRDESNGNWSARATTGGTGTPGRRACARRSIGRPRRFGQESSRSEALIDPAIVGPAIGEALRKFDPRHLWRNPVMFIVEIGAVMTTVVADRHLVGGGGPTWFVAWITAWLWFTVLFSNFAEAMAEGRGKAQADTLRQTRTETMAKVLLTAIGPGSRPRPPPTCAPAISCSWKRGTSSPATAR